MSANLGLVYGTTGNHEAHPTNAFPPKSVGNQAQWVYDTLSAAWTKWIGVSAAAQTKAIGAYSVKYPNGNLRVISLNTNMYYIQNYYLYQKNMEVDPSGQLGWLIQELNAAEAAGERVFIIGHMPLGDSDCFRDGSNSLDQVGHFKHSNPSFPSPFNARPLRTSETKLTFTADHEPLLINHSCHVLRPYPQGSLPDYLL
jgi:sphingomyelin phosphodiesterase